MPCNMQQLHRTPNVDSNGSTDPCTIGPTVGSTHLYTELSADCGTECRSFCIPDRCSHGHAVGHTHDLGSHDQITNRRANNSSTHDTITHNSVSNCTNVSSNVCRTNSDAAVR